MTAPSPGSENLVFYSKQEIVDHLLRKVLANTNCMVGTEVEMFFLDNRGRPITKENGQRAFIEIHRALVTRKHKATLIKEYYAPDASEKIIGLTANGYGAINLEAGHQFEFASSVCKTPDEVFNKNAAIIPIMHEAARAIGHQVVFSGHWKNYAALSEGVFRSRGRRWREYYETRFGEHALDLRKAQDGTASTQITLDCGAENFHEYFKALLLLDPVLSIANANSDRGYVIRKYGEEIGSQVKPLLDVWNTKSPREALEVIVTRLMQIDVPFLPDPEKPGHYQALPLDANKRPPTVQQMMDRGELSEQALNNIGGFFYTWPAFRNLNKALLEVRGIDSLGQPEAIARAVRCVTDIVYDDTKRRQFLRDYADLDTDDLLALHNAATSWDRPHAMAMPFGKRGGFVATLVDDVHQRTGSGAPSALPRSTRKSAGSTLGGGSGRGCSQEAISPSLAAAAKGHHQLPGVSVLGLPTPPKSRFGAHPLRALVA